MGVKKKGEIGSALQVTPGGNQVDGLPPATSSGSIALGSPLAPARVYDAGVNFRIFEIVPPIEFCSNQFYGIL